MGLGFLFFAVNLILRSIFLDAQDIALDEPFSIFWAKQSPESIWHLASNENNPPLHFWILHFWMQLFGDSVFAIRLSSLLASSLLCGLSVAFLRKRSSIWAAILAGCLFSLSTEHMFYSHEARTYALLCLLTLLAFQKLVMIVEDPANPRNYIHWGIFTSLMMYTHYLSIWVILASCCVWVLWGDPGKNMRYGLMSLAGLMLAFLPLAIPALLRLEHMSQTGTWVPKPVWTQIYGHINILLNGWTGTAVLFLGIGTLKLYRFISERKVLSIIKAIPKGLAALLFGFAIMYIGLYAQSFFFQPVFIPRYLVFTSVPLFLGLAWSADWLAMKQWQTAVLAIAMIVAMFPGFHLNPSNHRDMKGLVIAENAFRQGKTVVILCPASFDLAYSYHLLPQVFNDPENFAPALLKHQVYAINHAGELPMIRLKQADRVILIDADSEFSIPGNGIKSTLDKEFQSLDQSRVEAIFHVIAYGQKPGI